MQSAGLMVDGVLLHAALREASSALAHEHELAIHKAEDLHRRSTINQVKVLELEVAKGREQLQEKVQALRQAQSTNKTSCRKNYRCNHGVGTGSSKGDDRYPCL